MNLGPHLLALAVASYPISDRASSRALPGKTIVIRYRAILPSRPADPQRSETDVDVQWNVNTLEGSIRSPPSSPNLQSQS